MQRFFIAFLSITALLMGCAVQGMAGEIQEKEFPFNKETIVAAYNDTMQKFADFRPLDPAKEQRGHAKYADTRSYMLTPNVGVIFEMNWGGANPTHVEAVGVADGSKETQALIVLNCMTLLAAVTPGWEGEERGTVAKELGITTVFPPVGAVKSLSYGDRDFRFANNGKQGVTLTISPTSIAGGASSR